MKLYDYFKQKEEKYKIQWIYSFEKESDGVELVFTDIRLMKNFFTDHFQYMKEEKLASKVIYKTMFIWRR